MSSATLESKDPSDSKDYAIEWADVLVGESVRIATFATPLDEYVRRAEDMWGKMDVTWKEIKPGTGSSHAVILRDFALAVREGRQPLAPATEGIKSLELANAITLSSVQRRTVDLPLDRAAYAAFIAEKTA